MKNIQKGGQSIECGERRTIIHSRAELQTDNIRLSELPTRRLLYLDEYSARGVDTSSLLSEVDPIRLIYASSLGYENN